MTTTDTAPLTAPATPDHPSPNGPDGRWAEAECWSDSDRAELECQRVLDITHDVKTFVFAAVDGRPFRFRAGQFITLQLEVDGRPIQRCYTISSPPTRPDRLSITVKRVPGGPVSNWLHDHLQAGHRLTALAPLGIFTLTDAPPTERSKYLFLSAGSGITPMMSMTRSVSDLGSAADIAFVHSARTPDDIIFRHELAAIAAVSPAIRLTVVCEADGQTERWQGFRGRLTAAMLQATVPDLTERTVYLCGPPGYRDATAALLVGCGIERGQIREESFEFAQLPITEQYAVELENPVPPDDGLTEEVRSFSVEMVRSGRTISCGPGQTVLEAAFAAGLRPPSSCTQGLCGTCKTTLLSGEVDMNHQGGIRPREIAQDKILICCSTPLSDLRVDS